MAYKQALQAYQKAQHSAMSMPYMEKSIFARAISLLRQAQQNMGDYQGYAAALKFNQRLWTFIQSHLSDSDDQIPRKIRINLLNLSLFVDQQSIRALSNPMAAQLDALIEINIDVSRGLATEAPSPRLDPDDSPSYGFQLN